ncbi:hypothetical protein L1987_48750 [Smallanthus sonchifolius]|uniref:Uncharacterized protein n=1 Tax=Smallanthus sonchifolius TaxID=185202 RepID=A0ACB9FTP7_9ASTR|nr:hypothetical protein L1987_48750 [Smallanthus sonchifolius]
MMRLLTGTDNEGTHSFQFVPLSVDAFGSTVIVEGCDPCREISWIHAWTVNSCGIITQGWEYFNTSLTVTHFDSNSSKSNSITSLHCPSLWESSLSNRVGKSVPVKTLCSKPSPEVKVKVKMPNRIHQLPFTDFIINPKLETEAVFTSATVAKVSEIT